MTESEDKKWFFKYLFEQQDWNAIDPDVAHELHHDDHHVHDKTKEEFHYFNFGGRLMDRLTVSVDLPYIIRESLEIESHSRLGQTEESKGMGDLHVVGDYRFFQDDVQSAGFLAGVKFPTGETDVANSVGEVFEMELQPGSGSYDYIIGGVYQKDFGRVKLLSNLAYVLKTEGDQDFRYGDLFSTAFFLDYVINPQSESLKTQIGINGNLQYEQKHEDAGVESPDSGGTTFFLGPLVSVEAVKKVSVFGSILFPVHQDLGGVHQELDFNWTAGGRISF